MTYEERRQTCEACRKSFTLLLRELDCQLTNISDARDAITEVWSDLEVLAIDWLDALTPEIVEDQPRTISEDQSAAVTR